MYLRVLLAHRWGAGLPRGPEREAAHQRGLQAQRGQAVRHPLHRVAVHERLHGAARDLRSAHLLTLWSEANVRPCRLLLSRCGFAFVVVDVVYHPWKKEEAGNQTREIMYTISLSNPLAPKTSTASETQVPRHQPQICGIYFTYSSLKELLENVWKGEALWRLEGDVHSEQVNQIFYCHFFTVDSSRRPINVELNSSQSQLGVKGKHLFPPRKAFWDVFFLLLIDF